MKKVIALSVLGLLALAGVAQAGDVLGSHEDPQLDQLARRAQRLERVIGRRSDGATASRRSHPGRRGPRGRRGPKGPPGPPGPAGAFGKVTKVESGPAFLCSFGTGTCAVGSAKVECPAGTVVTGGGYTGAGILTTVTYSAPTGNGWGVIGVNFDEVAVSDLKATALCAS